MRHDLELCFTDADLTIEVRSFRIEEAMNRPFEVFLVARSAQPLDLARLIGSRARFCARPESGPTVFAPDADWSGFIVSLEETGEEFPSKRVYEAHLVHPLWVLGQNKSHRVFQHLSELDMARALLGEWRIRENVLCDPTRYKKRDYRIQYGESDLDFFHRNLEDLGVSYYLEDSEEGEVVTFTDAPEKAPPRAQSLRHFEEPPTDARCAWAARVRVRRSLRPGRHVVQDVDYRLPSTAQPRLLCRFAEPKDDDPPVWRVSPLERALEVFQYDPGAFAVESQGATDSPVADRKQSTRTDTKYGAWLTEQRLRAAQARRYRVRFETNLFDLHPGSVVRIDDHDAVELAEPVLVLQTTITGEDAGAWKVECVAHPTELPCVPEIVTARPRAKGIETASVVGTRGASVDGQEQGSVLVQFHWDREGTYDDDSSCWVPVSYLLAGPSRGTFSMPRVGEEVLVDFLCGDFDKPMVVGRVYTGLNRPWTTDVEKMGDLSIKNDSLEDAAQHCGVHLTADGKPLMHWFSTHDKCLTVGNDQRNKVANNRSTSVAACCSTIVGGDRSTTVTIHQCCLVGASSSENVGGSKTVRVRKITAISSKSDGSVTGEGGLCLSSKLDARLRSLEASTTLKAPKIHISATDEIAILCAGSVLILRPQFVLIHSNKTDLNPGGPATAQALETGDSPLTYAERLIEEEEKQQRLKEAQLAQMTPAEKERNYWYEQAQSNNPEVRERANKELDRLTRESIDAEEDPIERRKYEIALEKEKRMSQ